MNRERLTILRDHLASLPDERFDMGTLLAERSCGTVACISGWSRVLFGDGHEFEGPSGGELLGLSDKQASKLFIPTGWMLGLQSRADAIAAIQSMLDSPDDDALPVWPEARS